ncbi:hypothetical protein JCM16303_000150 [Sporobolomyces ruberrimus]
MGKLLGKIWQVYTTSRHLCLLLLTRFGAHRVGGTLALISFIGFTSQLFVIIPSYAPTGGFSDPELLKLLVPFNVLLFLLYTNYFLTVKTNPGNVPKGWEPNWKEIELGQAEVKKLSGTARFCRTCQTYKPPRAHHCRQCKTCVLKMDHHCPWVNNCVGHHNHGHFIRFLFYVDLACSYHLWMITRRAFGITAFQRAPTTFQIIILILNYTACVPVLLIVGVFSLFGFWNVLVNSTTIENWEKDKVASLKRRGKIRQYRYPYHLGYVRNLKDVLGPNPFTWWIPQKAPGDGLSYKVGEGLEPHEQYLWPPRDEFVKPKSRRPTKPTGSPFTYGTGLNPLLTGTAAVHSEGGEPIDSGLRRRRRGKGSRSSSRSSSASRSTSSSPSIDLSSDYESKPRQEDAQEEEDEEDDIPLGSLAARRTRTASSTVRTPGQGAGEEEEFTDEDEDDLDPDRVVRIRRGSEGYEIRPRFFQPPPQPPAFDRPYVRRNWEEEGDSEWEQLEGAGHEEEGDPYAEEMVSEGELDDEGNRVRRGARYKYYVREEDSESDTEDEVEVVPPLEERR